MNTRAKGNLYFIYKNSERRKKTMYQKGFNVFALLLVAMLVFAGCGSTVSNSTVSNTSGEGKTAKATISFDFPDEEVGSALLSDATTHILVNVKQWTTDDLNNLRVVNTDKALLTKTSPSTTIDLFPTYTRVCASQYKGDPNDYVTRKHMETACTFGKLNPGSNTVNLTMLRGTWTLGTAFNDISAVALAKVSGSYEDWYDVGVMDGIPSGDFDPFASGISCYNNWGCLYQTMFKKAGVWQFLTFEESGTGYSNTFNSPNILIGAVEEGEVEVIGDGIGDDDGICETDERCDWITKSGFAIGGVSGTVDTTKGFVQQKDIVSFAEYLTPEYQSNQDCQYGKYGKYGGIYQYKCLKPVLVTVNTEMKIESTTNNGTSYTDVTSTEVNPCILQITGGNSIAGCGIKDTDFAVGTQTSHSHRITNTTVVKAVSGCYMDMADMGADKDVSGNIICYSYDYSYWWDGTQYVYNCWDGGSTYNSTTQRCEISPANLCTQRGGTFDTTAGTCTMKGYSYLTTLKTPTSITLTGVGSLPSSMSTTTN